MTEVNEQLERPNEDQIQEFAKRSGTSGATKGHQNEIKLVMLFLLQGKINEEIESFYLASNMDNVGAFDDVVFKYTYNKNEVKKTNIIFLQAKHKESTKNIDLKTLLAKTEKGEFTLKKYLTSYKRIKQQFESNRNHPIFENEFDDSKYYIYTNATFNFNNCQDDVEKCEVERENILILKEKTYYKMKDSDQVMCALRNLPKPIIPAEDAEIRDFLKQLRIFDSQFNEEELEKEIIKIIESTYSVNNREAASIFSDAYAEVKTWWQSEKTYYLTEKNTFFENAKQNFFKLSLVGLGELSRAQMETLKLRFKTDHVKELMKSIDSNQILNIFTKNIKLTTAKVYQVLEDMPEYKTSESDQYDYKYMILNSVINIQKKVKECFNKINLLVLVSKYFDENLEKLFHELSKKNKDKKMIMIRQRNKLGTKISRTGKSEYEDQTKNLLELTEESQKQLIIKVRVTFQGEKIKFNSFLKDNKIKEFVDEVILSELVNTSRISIGESLKKLGEIENYYISRIFNRLVKIKSDLKYEKSEFYVKYNSKITKKSIEQNQDIVLISDKEDDFYKLCTDENYESKNIHWLKEENSQLTWEQSRGSLSKLRNYIDEKIVNSVKETDMIKIKDKVVIISAEPGMGKSTVLTTLAELVKKSDPSLWVQTINLNDHTDHLQKMDLKKDRKEETIKLLLNIVKPKSGLETELFKRRISEEGKIVLLFDGFDEISPIYDNKVIELLNVLRDTKAQKLWITTRPHLRTKLEDKLGVIAYTLKPLTRDDQITFLKNFWNQRLSLNIELDNRSDSFICELLDVLKKSISDEELQFTGVPLQTRMLAESFQDKFKDFHDSKEEVLNLPKSLNLVGLYQKFIDKKCRILYQEKKAVILTKPEIQKEYNNKFYPGFLRKHKILGIDLIFYEENEFLTMGEQNVIKKFKNDFNKEDDKTGIVIQILNDKPIFIHRTFAEFFAALWFADKVKENNKQINNKLHKYIFKNEYEFLKIVFDRLLITNKCKLHNAVLNNDEKQVKLLLHDVNIKFDKGGRTAIHLAASYGYENILKILLENSNKKGSIFYDTIDRKDKVFNLSALMYAVKCYHWNTVELLLQNDAKSDEMFETNSGINKRILIHLAAEKGYMKLIKVILQNRAKYRPITNVAPKIGKDLLNRNDRYDIDYKNKQFETPLYTAVAYNQIEVVKLLVDNGANINSKCTQWSYDNWSIFHMAAKRANKEIVEYLINKGAETNAIDRKGKTPLYLAVENNNIEVVKLLVDNGANINAKNLWDWSILHIAADVGTKEIVEFLINKGADINAVDENGETPLYLAVQNEKFEVVKLLVVNGGNIHAKCSLWNDWSLLHIATSRGNKEIVEFLIDKGADINAVVENGETPLYLAVKNEKIEVVKLLVDNGAKINAECASGHFQKRSILHIAAHVGTKEIVEFLINKGSDINAVGENGETPLYLAVQNEKIEVVKLLVENGADIKANNANGPSWKDRNWSILHIAAYKGNTEIIEFLINKGADINAENINGETSMYLAIQNEKIEVVKLLVDKGSNINAKNEYNLSILHFAAWAGNREFVEFLINKGADTNAENSNGETPLYLAVQTGKLEVVKLLVAKGANINAKNEYNLSILHFAAWIGNKPIVEFLINKGADTNAENRNGETPLYLAVQTGKIEVVKLLVDKGANINAKNEYDLSILHFAASLDNKEIVEFLINKGSDINAVDDNGETPLHLAVQNEKIEVVKLLVENGANINANNANGPSWNDRNWSILHIAAYKGNKEIIEFLINKGAHINAENINGETSLYLAVQNEKIEVVKLLVDNGANIHAKCALWDDWSILQIAASRGKKEIVEFLINKGADINAVDKNGFTPLYLAVEKEKLEVLKLLVDNGANINVKYTNDPLWKVINCSILHIAARKGNKEIVEFLINKTADINAVDEDNKTPLYLAVENNKIEVVKLLVDNGSNINANNADGPSWYDKNWSILHIATSTGNKEIVEFLVNKGAETNAVDRKGKTPLYLAVENNNTEVVKLLVDNGANINAKNLFDWSILHIPADVGTKEIVEFLINKGADINAVDENGETPLYLAVQNEKIEVIKLLVDNGANINAKCALWDDWSILHLAASRGNKEIVAFLINNGADINAVDEYGNTPLYLAVEYEKIEVAKLLVDNGANINAKNLWDLSILHIAADVGTKKIVEFLIKKGAETTAVDRKGETPLYFAVENNNIEVVKLLVDNGANINAKNLCERSILHIAADVGTKEVMEFLINKGAAINAIDGNGETPLNLAVQNEKIEVLKLLVDNGSNINAKCGLWDDWSILHMAASTGNKEIVEFLINKGADINAVDKNGFTPLYLAVQKEKFEVLRTFVDNGANINVKYTNDPLWKGINWSILHIAARKGNKEIVEYLINKRADINAADEDSKTPLYLAVENENIEVVRLLVDNGANINANNEWNWSILHKAAYKGNKEIVEFLINKGADINAANSKGRTPLYVAVEADKIEIVKLLVENGADINANNADGPSWYDKNWSILHIAASTGNKEIVGFLINKGAYTNAKDKEGKAPLDISMKCYKYDIAKLLNKTGMR